MSRACFPPMCSHLRINLLERRMQELLLPEQAAAANTVISIYASHKWHLEFAGDCKGPHIYAKKSLQLIEHSTQHT